MGRGDHGLYKCPDGRYRINASGENFTEHDERVVVKRFREWQSKNGQEPLPMVRMRVDPEVLPPVGREDVGRQLDRVVELAAGGHLEMTTDGKTARITAHITDVPKSILWGYFREMCLNHPEVVAKETGIPEIANLRHMSLPRPSRGVSRT